ncbi:MAG: LPS export ABC transporter periplasmic protein LptC [Psychrilyobacter sp.]|nr:LPS export ABC transporter periplasmic protein LptC [Psychrilyobacter sp.]
MLKKILRYLGGVLFIVFIYFNYIKEPEVLEKNTEDKMITSGVSYDVEKYHIEANKQIDDTKKNIRLFEKAIAKFDGMKLSGDDAKVDSTNNLYLNNNIVGIATNGWKLEANEAHYDTKAEKIYASNKVKAYNEEKGITLYGDTIVTDTKLNDLNLTDDIRVMTKNMQLSGNYAHYNNSTQILDLKENIKIRGRKLGALEMDEVSGLFTEITYDGKKRIIHSKGDFVLYYKGANLRAKDFVYYEETGNFTISEDVVVGFSSGRLTVEKINYVASENKMYFIGPVNGTYGEYSIEADNGSYDSTTNLLDMSGNIKIKGETSLLLADIGTYNIKTNDLYMTSEKLVRYTDTDMKVLTKDFTYNEKTKKFNLLNSYDYKGKDFESIGHELYYDEGTKIGKIIDGTFKSPEVDGKANKVDFNMATKKYSFVGDAKAKYSGSTLTSQKIDIDDVTKLVNIDGSYTIYNPEDKTTFYGQQAIYNMTSGDLISNGKIKVVQENKILTGTNLTYNSITGLGEIESKVVVTEPKGARMVGDHGKFNTNSYVEVIGNLKITNEGTTTYANSGKYVFADEKVYIPGKIKTISKDGKMTMYDGVYSIKNKRIIAKNFNGVSGDKKASGNIVNYYLDRSVVQLDENVIIETPTMKFVGSQVEYSFLTDDISTHKPYKIYYPDYVMDGKTMKGNTEDEVATATKTTINSSNGEKLYGDFVYADMKNKQVDLNGNVRALAYNIDKKTGKKIPVKIRGKTAKIFLYDNKGGNLAISRMEIKEKGIYEYQDMTLKSDYMEIDMIKNLALGRHGNKLNIDGQTDVEAEIADIDMNTEIVNLINNVKFRDKDKDGKITTATSDKGQIRNKEDIVILRENVVADTEANHIEADYTKYNIETGILNAKGNVRVDYK